MRMQEEIRGHRHAVSTSQEHVGIQDWMDEACAGVHMDCITGPDRPVRCCFGVKIGATVILETFEESLYEQQ